MANPERSTELLWGSRTRGGLSLDRIVRTAVELADAEGLGAVSMRRLADRLGFTTMALYRHVPGKAVLVALMYDAALAGWGAVPGPDPETSTDTGPGSDANPGSVTSPDPGADWRADLAAWARGGLDVHRRHPWLADAEDPRRVPGPNAVAAFERALEITARTGLPPAEVVAAASLVSGVVAGAAQRSAAETRAERGSGVGFEEWWGRRDSLYAHLDRYPTLSRLYREGAYDAPPDSFDYGLERTLDGIEARIRDVVRYEKACEVCGRPVADGPAGRPRAYCSAACRQRAYRHRRRTEA
jgi:AcrR family transcriptional regulator